LKNPLLWTVAAMAFCAIFFFQLPFPVIVAGAAVIGFAGAVFGGWAQVSWLAPLGMGGLFCHYWLDGRIWTRRSRVV
jgi:chromate transporter